MLISSRLPATFQTNALSLALAACKDSPYLDLTISNPTRCGLDFGQIGLTQEGLARALSTEHVFQYSPDAAGSLAAREAVGAYHGISPDAITLTASTSEAYSWLFKLLGNPGDSFLVPSPSYPLFDWLARLEGVRTLPVNAYYADRWHLDLEGLERACERDTRALILVNPNNPTGHFISKDEWAWVLDFCARQRLALIVDEVFAPYALEKPADALSTALDQSGECPIFVLSGLSKLTALPQIKAGWILAASKAALKFQEHLHFIADQYLSVSAPAQAALPWLLEKAPAIQALIRDRLTENLAQLDAALSRENTHSRLRVEGGWTVLLRRPLIEDDETHVLRLLTEKQVLTQPGHFFDLPEGYLVLSLMTQPSFFKEGLGRLL